MIQQAMQFLGSVFTWWVVITPWQRGIRVRLGKRVKELNPGVHLKIPMLHQVYRQNVRLMMVDTPIQTLTTLDGKVVTLSMVVGYQIADVLKVYNSVQRPQETIQSLAMGAVAQHVTQRTANECSVAEVEQELLAVLVGTNWGLEFSYVKVSDFAFVKTYRLIGNDDRRGFWGGSVDVEHPVGHSE